MLPKELLSDNHRGNALDYDAFSVNWLFYALWILDIGRVGLHWFR